MAEATTGLFFQYEYYYKVVTKPYRNSKNFLSARVLNRQSCSKPVRRNVIIVLNY